MAEGGTPPNTPEAEAAPRDGALRDTDPIALLETVKQYIGFTDADSRLLRSLYPHVEPHLFEIIDVFYERILGNPGARKAITGGEAQIARLKSSQMTWLRLLLEGPHDAGFALLQARIGRMHVKVGLDQAYMVTGVQVFRDQLMQVTCGSFPAGDERCMAVLRAVDKALTIVLALMLETYRDDFIRKIIQTEKGATMRRLAALGEVAANLAHEIRNPLAGISGAIQVLAQEIDGGHPHRQILTEILREIGRLDERVNDLLVYSRPSVPAREPIHPAELLETVRRLLLDDPLARGVRITVEAGEEIGPFSLDPHQIRQVIVNLVLNALQALKGRGDVRLRARRLPARGLEISVEDSGPGIRPEELERVFQPFFTTRTGGTGLGLSISRRLVEAHGGTLEAGRGALGGACFVITLPAPLPPET